MIMRFYEFKTIQPIKPLTAPQARINALKQQKERVGKQLKTERDTQKKQKAVAAIQKNNQTIANINSGN
jgi:hypothetical protein